MLRRSGLAPAIKTIRWDFKRTINSQQFEK